ncbi:carboxynorspermidine decarboxylase [Verrucomicrobiota bacterium]
MKPNEYPTPYFAVDRRKLEENLKLLKSVKDRTGCKILLATKSFSMWKVAPLVMQYLDGTCASSPWEARMGREEFGGEVHAFAAAYSETDIRDLLETCNDILFNSFAQWNKFKPLIEASGKKIKCGLRINPEHSTGDTPIYDPCAPNSRLGIPLKDFEGQSLDGISGLHFHTLCEQDSDDLETTLAAVEEKFGHLIPQLEWFNFGGGHHITRPDYDIDRLCRLVSEFQDKYGVQVYLEPGEAVALNAGVLVTSVMDLKSNGMDIAIIDASAAAHMPDVLEMPYRPRLCRCPGHLVPAEGLRAGEEGEKSHTYRLGGHTCLAGDVIGDYSFDTPLKAGDRLMFEDMAIYSMVKSTMFNGVQHPAITLYEAEANELEIVREFSYADFKTRLS